MKHSAIAAFFLLITLLSGAGAEETVCASRKGVQILREAGYTEGGSLEIPLVFHNLTDYVVSAWYVVDITDGDGKILFTEEMPIENINSRKRNPFTLSVPAGEVPAARQIKCDLADIKFRADPVRQEFNIVKDRVGFKVEVIKDAVVLRPDMNSIDSLGAIPRGTILIVTAKDLWQSISGPDHAEWYQVTLEDKTGWISQETCRRINGGQAQVK